MKLGYPCINRSFACRADKSFRLNSFTPEKFHQTVQSNLDCLENILAFNLKHRLYFFRISSQTIPFASHPINTTDWVTEHQQQLVRIGNFIKKHGMRISMHPDQFTLINSPKDTVVQNSFKELSYHATFLDTMGLDTTAKIQIHVGGIYGDKKAAITKFRTNFAKLPPSVQKRLAIENDDRLYSLKDCLMLASLCHIPVIFDTFHHECLNHGEPMLEAMTQAAKTWKASDGELMIDYSSQEPAARKGKHATSIDLNHFKTIYKILRQVPHDLMLEIKDKEKSALQARKVIYEDASLPIH